MYESFFGLIRPPFDRQLLADQLFRTPALDELHSRLSYLVRTRSLGLLTGEPGSGKSTALRRLRDSLHPEKVRAVYLHDTTVNPADFFRQLEPPRLLRRPQRLRGWGHGKTRQVPGRGEGAGGAARI